MPSTTGEGTKGVFPVTLNVDVPIFPAYVRMEHLYDMTAHADEFVECYVFGVTSIPARAIGFHIMLNNGAQIDRLPICALVHKRTAPRIPLDFLQLWDCFSYDVTCLRYDYLTGLRCATILKDKTWHEGVYEFTLDWHGSSIADDPGEGGHKSAHIIRLDNGCFAAQPNHRMRWYEPSFITKPFPIRPDYKTNSYTWTCENKGGKWVTSDDDRQFYDLVTEKGA